MGTENGFHEILALCLPRSLPWLLEAPGGLCSQTRPPRASVPGPLPDPWPGREAWWGLCTTSAVTALSPEGRAQLPRALPATCGRKGTGRGEGAGPGARGPFPAEGAFTPAHTGRHGCAPTLRPKVPFPPIGPQSPTSRVLLSDTGHSKVNGGFDLGTKAGVPGTTRGPHGALPQQDVQAPSVFLSPSS